jgi:hypothetical protein
MRLRIEIPALPPKECSPKCLAQYNCLSYGSPEGCFEYKIKTRAATLISSQALTPAATGLISRG